MICNFLPHFRVQNYNFSPNWPNKSFYLLHNHPDEENRPSDDDIIATKVIEKTAKNLGIKLIDHLVIFKGGYSCIKKETKTSI